MSEPENTHDETNSKHSAGLERRLQAEEPPINDDDTSPSRRAAVHQRLAAEEPPVRAGDTHPSQIVRPPRVHDRPPRRGAGRLLQAIAVLLLTGAFVLVALAAYVWVDVGQSDASETPDDVAEMEGIPERDESPLREQATSTPPPPAGMTLPPPPFNGIDAIFPTAAADEIAAALLTPAAIEPPRDSVVRRVAPFTIERSTGRQQIVRYTVQEGDTIESIAEAFGLSDHYTIIWSNRSSDYNPLRPGAQLNILPEDGVYHEVTENVTIGALAAEYDVDPYTIIDAEYNDLFGSTPDTLLVKGMRVAIPGAEAERELFLPQRVDAGGGGSAGVISGSYTLWGCTANVQGGTLPYGRPLGNYTWMRGVVPGGHTGVDLAASTGDPIYAAGAGTVVYSGWSNGGYGNVVVIAHGPVFTIYGHMSSRNVRCGQQVGAGEVIGAVGNTGNSSGPHLHFEVRDADFNVLNPQNWVQF